MTEYCYECEYAYQSDNGDFYCDYIEDGDYGDCPMLEDEEGGCGKCGRVFENGFMVDDGGTTIEEEQE